MIENPKKAPSRPLYLDEKSGKPTRYNVYLEDLAEAISGSRDIPHMMRYLTDKGFNRLNYMEVAHSNLLQNQQLPAVQQLCMVTMFTQKQN